MPVLLATNVLDHLFNYFSSQFAVHILSALEENKTLAGLNQSRNDFHSEDPSVLAIVNCRGLSHNRTLKVLRMNSCSLASLAIEAIANAMANRSGLEVLHIE